MQIMAEKAWNDKYVTIANIKKTNVLEFDDIDNNSDVMTEIIRSDESETINKIAKMLL